MKTGTTGSWEVAWLCDGADKRLCCSARAASASAGGGGGVVVVLLLVLHTAMDSDGRLRWRSPSVSGDCKGSRGAQAHRPTNYPTTTMLLHKTPHSNCL